MLAGLQSGMEEIIGLLFYAEIYNPANIYLFKVNNRKSRKKLWNMLS